jgi:hypothetical protein
VTIATLTASFALVAEADCTVGYVGTDWQANATSPGTDQFVLNVDDDGEFAVDRVNVPPYPVASGNVLTTGSLAASGTRSVDVQLVMPTAVTGTVACGIPLIFTASS